MMLFIRQVKQVERDEFAAASRANHRELSAGEGLLTGGGLLLGQVDMVDQPSDVGKTELAVLVAVDISAGPTAQRLFAEINVVDQDSDIGQGALTERVAVGVSGETAGEVTAAAGIADVVAVGIELVGIVRGGAVVADIADTITVGIGLIGVRNVRTIVERGWDAITVGIYQHGIGSGIETSIVSPHGAVGQLGMPLALRKTLEHQGVMAGGVGHVEIAVIIDITNRDVGHARYDIALRHDHREALDELAIG